MVLKAAEVRSIIKESMLKQAFIRNYMGAYIKAGNLNGFPEKFHLLDLGTGYYRQDWQGRYHGKDYRASADRKVDYQGNNPFLRGTKADIEIALPVSDLDTESAYISLQDLIEKQGLESWTSWITFKVEAKNIRERNQPDANFEAMFSVNKEDDVEIKGNLRTQNELLKG